MILFLRSVFFLILIMFVAGCASYEPVWRMKAHVTLLQLQQENAAAFYPEDYASVDKTFHQGEALLMKELKGKLADEQYKLAYQKGSILRLEVLLYQEKLKEDARLKEIEERSIREEEVRIRREAERKRQDELREAQQKIQSKTSPEEPAEIQEEHHYPQPTTYTVRRGETLPQIAARPELYNDVALWPLIYRANRDQIRDPYQLWPGQILKIPRNFSRDEALDARRQAHRRKP